MDLFLRKIPKEHKKFASDWFANGILSPKESRKELPRENFTLTASDYSYHRNKGEFTYILESSVFPFSGWEYKEVKKWSLSASILKMYSEYVSHRSARKMCLKVGDWTSQVSLPDVQLHGNYSVPSSRPDV